MLAVAKAKRKHRSKEKCLRFRRWDSGNRITCRQCNHNLKKHSDNCKNRGIFIGANEFHQRIHLPQVIWVYIKYRENKKYAWQHKITAAIKDNILYVASFRGFISYSSFSCQVHSDQHNGPNKKHNQNRCRFQSCIVHIHKIVL